MVLGSEGLGADLSCAVCLLCQVLQGTGGALHLQCEQSVRK